MPFHVTRSFITPTTTTTTSKSGDVTSRAATAYSVQALSTLTTAQLHSLLDEARVPYHDCIEKHELVVRLLRNIGTLPAHVVVRLRALMDRASPTTDEYHDHERHPYRHHHRHQDQNQNQEPPSDLTPYGGSAAAASSPSVPAPATPMTPPLVPSRSSVAAVAMPDEDHVHPRDRESVDIFARCSPSTVHITTLALARTTPFTTDVTAIPAGSGSGFIWDDQGHIVTNYHVIQKAWEARQTRGGNSAQLRITLSSGEAFPASIVGVDPERVRAIVLPRLSRFLTSIPG